MATPFVSGVRQAIRRSRSPFNPPWRTVSLEFVEVVLPSLGSRPVVDQHDYDKEDRVRVEIAQFGWLNISVQPTVNTFLVNGTTMIDTGPVVAWSAVRNYIKSRPQIERIMITHHHEDHCGNAANIKREFPHIQIITPEHTAEIVADSAKSTSTLGYHGLNIHPYRKFLFGRPEPFAPDAVWEHGDVHLLSDPRGDRGLHLQLHRTPGHCDDHHCMVLTRGGVGAGPSIIFTGDLYVGANVKTARCDENYLEFLHSLRNLLDHVAGPSAFSIDVYPAVLFCAHRGRIDEGISALRTKITHLETLKRQSAALADEGLTPSQIARRLLGREDTITYFSGGHFGKRFLIEQLLDEPEMKHGDEIAMERPRMQNVGGF
eukprot:Clim_evm26s109 gene=Clim_evmTU26s109